MIHKSETPPFVGTYSISSGSGWVTGIYATERAANYAFRFCDRALYEMQQQANQNETISDRVITFEDLRAYRKAHPDTWNKN